MAESGFAGTTISRGDLGGKYDYSALPVRQSGAENLRRRMMDDHWPGVSPKIRWYWPPRPLRKVVFNLSMGGLHTRTAVASYHMLCVAVFG